MLVLSRRIGESLRINDEIVVTVSEVRGGQVRFGIAAPRCVEVHRKEVYVRIKADRGREPGRDAP